MGAGNGGDDHSSGGGGGELARKLAPSEEVIHWETKEEEKEEGRGQKYVIYGDVRASGKGGAGGFLSLY